MKTAPPMNTFTFFTLCELHQLWQAVILMSLKLERYILDFWKPPIFICLDIAGQDHGYILNTWKSIPKIASLIVVYLVGINSQLHTAVTRTLT